jgi:hypothetical protein
MARACDSFDWQRNPGATASTVASLGRFAREIDVSEDDAEAIERGGVRAGCVIAVSYCVRPEDSDLPNTQKSRRARTEAALERRKNQKEPEQKARWQSQAAPLKVSLMSGHLLGEGVR